MLNKNEKSRAENNLGRHIDTKESYDYNHRQSVCSLKDKWNIGWKN